MITKKILPLFAMLAVFIVVAVPYASAAGERSVNSHQIDIAIGAHDNYDEVVNLADPANAATNVDTWTPSPQGIWLGASTEESLFQFDEVLPSSNNVILYHSARFNSTQIMNGASVTVIRSPFSAEGLSRLSLAIYRLDSPGWNISGWSSSGPYSYPLIDGDVNTVAAVMFMRADEASITSGPDYWTIDDRTYVELHAPLYSGYEYLFEWSAEYAKDCRPAVYLTTQDVANDDLIRTVVTMRYATAPDQVHQQIVDWEVDPGVSYDMRQGLGGGIYAESRYMKSGDTLSFDVKSLPDPGVDAYETLMIPFATDDHQLKAKVELRDGSGNTLWTASRTTWADYILTSSPEAKRSLPTGYTIQVVVTLLEDKRVNWIFIDNPRVGDVMPYTSTFVLDGVNHNVFARAWHSFQLSVQQVFAPSLDPADFPPMIDVRINEPRIWYGTILGAALIAGGVVVSFSGIGLTLGGMMVGSGISMIVMEYAAHQAGYTGLPDMVAGTFQGPLDNLWSGLCDAGNFIRAVGEAIYDGIVWFADAITEYGSVLLGLLIIAVSLALFFVPIYTQLKLWGIAWRMAEGDLQAAAAQAQDLASQASGVMSKFRRH